jgi:hypothetical protein
MQDESVYTGIGGWIAFHFRLAQMARNRRYERTCQWIARHLPLSVRLYVLAYACSKAMKYEDITDIEKVNYAAMHRGETEGKVQ